MLAEGYFWSADQGFGHETQAPVQRRRGDGRVRGRAGGDGDGDVGGGDYHVLQLLRVSHSPSLSLSLSLFLSLSLTRTHTHTLSLSLSLPPLSLSLSVKSREEKKKKNPPTTHQKPSFNLATAIASLDDIMLTSPRGCVWRCVLGGDNTRVEKGADSRKITNSVES